MSGVPTSIRVSITDHGRLPPTLCGRLEQRRAALVEGLSFASDWPDFKQRLGVIAGLKEALEICEQIEKDTGER